MLPTDLSISFALKALAVGIVRLVCVYFQVIIRRLCPGSNYGRGY